jgi:hypothetical protein
LDTCAKANDEVPAAPNKLKTAGPQQQAVLATAGTTDENAFINSLFELFWKENATAVGSDGSCIL